MLTFTCFAQQSNPAVYSYRWYKDGQEISYQTAETFYVTGVTRTNTGNYQCEAKNSVGETKSTNTVQVSVRRKYHVDYPSFHSFFHHSFRRDTE